VLALCLFVSTHSAAPVRFIDAVVQLADAYPDYIVRYIVMELGYVSMLDGLVFFLYALYAWILFFIV